MSSRFCIYLRFSHGHGRPLATPLVLPSVAQLTLWPASFHNVTRLTLWPDSPNTAGLDSRPPRVSLSSLPRPAASKSVIRAGSHLLRSCHKRNATFLSEGRHAYANLLAWALAIHLFLSTVPWKQKMKLAQPILCLQLALDSCCNGNDNSGANARH